MCSTRLPWLAHFLHWWVPLNYSNPPETHNYISHSSEITKGSDSMHYWLLLQYFVKVNLNPAKWSCGADIAGLLIIKKWMHSIPLELRYWLETVTIHNWAHNVCMHTQLCLEASLMAPIHRVTAEFIHAHANLYSKVYSVVIEHVLKCSSGAKGSFLSRGFALILWEFLFFFSLHKCVF